jgi:amino acid transporter
MHAILDLFRQAGGDYRHVGSRTTTTGDCMDRSVVAGGPEPRLRRTLGRFDAVAFVITAVVVLDTIGAVAVGGAQAFVWLALMGVLFLYPSALIIAELGGAFPQEGGHYVWTRRAFGRSAGGVSALLYWAESPIWIGGSLAITAVAVVDRFLIDIHGRATLVGAGLFVALTIGCALLPMRLGRFVPIIGAASRIALLATFTAAVGLYAITNGVHGISQATDVSPSFAAFAAVVPVILYNYLGFDVPASAAGEMRDPQRDLPAAVLRGGLWTFALYAVPVAAILVVLPAGAVTSLRGFIDAIEVVFTPFGGHVAADGTVHLAGAGLVLGDLCAAGLVLVLLTSGATWLMGSVRSQAVACRDGAGPRSLGELDEAGIPRRLVLVSGAIATLTAVGAYLVSSSNADRYFSAALSLAIATIALSYIGVFAALPRLRSTHPGVERPYRIPGGIIGAYAASGMTLAWTVGALALLLWPPQLPATFAGERAAYELTQLAPLALLIAIGAVFVVPRSLGGAAWLGRTRQQVGRRG